MFAFEFKKFQVWLMMAALLLSCSVSLHLCYPQTEKDVDPTEAEADHNLVNPEDQELEQAGDEEEESSQEEGDSDFDVENDGYENLNADRTCIRPQGDCGPQHLDGRLPCCRHDPSGDFFICKQRVSWTFGKCLKIEPNAVQQALKAWAASSGFP